MKAFFLRWATTTFAVFIAAHIVPGISYETLDALLWAGLLLGILNAVVRPLLLLLSLPLILLTLGLFIPIVNAMLLSFVGGGWIAGFHVESFGSAVFGAIVISLVSGGVNRSLKNEDARGSGGIRMHTYHPTAPEEQPLAPENRPMKKVEGRVIE